MQSANNDNSMAQFLTRLFKRFNDEKLTYCVLRNYEELPEEVGNDVDIWVKDEHRKRLYEIVKDLADALDYTLDYTPRFSLIGEGDYFLIKEQGQKITVIHLDCWTYIHWKGICYIDESVIENNLQLYKKLFFIPSPGVMASIMMLKELLQHGKLKEKYKELTKEASKNDGRLFFNSICGPFGKGSAASILEMAVNGEWELLEQKAINFRLILLSRAILHPAMQLRKWLYYFRAQFRKYLVSSRGVFLVLIGPDGSGKSTTFANLIISELKRLFQKRYYFHGHFPYLPELKRIIAFFRGNKNASQPTGDTGSSKPMGTLRSMIYPVYYGLNYLLGHFFIWKEKARGNLIIFDRYFYDYFIQIQYGNCPKWLLSAIAKVIPKPDIIVYLKNTPKVIYRRKPELTIEEIERQAYICEELVKQNKQSYIVETTSTESVIEDIQKIIINKLKETRGIKKL